MIFSIEQLFKSLLSSKFIAVSLKFLIPKHGSGIQRCRVDAYQASNKSIYVRYTKMQG